MSVVSRVLNTYLSWTQRPHMQRASGADALRRDLKIKARLFFHAPFGMTQKWEALGAGKALVVEPKGQTPDRVILYFHGGGYVFGAPETHSAMLAVMAKRAGARAILPLYPLAPEHPFPAALDHAVAAYEACLAQFPASKIVIGGDSAGGGLALAVLARVLADGGERPAGVFAFSPLTDLTLSGDSHADNDASEVVLAPGRVATAAASYLGDVAQDHPFASPLFAEFTGAPPVWITVGSTEILRDDSRRMAERLREQGVEVTYIEEDDLPHVWPLFHNILPEARRTLAAAAGWVVDQTSFDSARR